MEQVCSIDKSNLRLETDSEVKNIAAIKKQNEENKNKIWEVSKKTSKSKKEGGPLFDFYDETG